MCGICGIFEYQKHDSNLLTVQNMMRIMKHRGPDDEGTFYDDHFTLGFVRLSIIDLSISGHQPMVSRDQRYVMAFNGEIYNYIELRSELTSKGYNFFTNTDSEVLLTSYIEWGESCLERFNGMWAFVIYDTIEKSVFGARDRFGIKPFYYLQTKDRFVFASDVNSIQMTHRDQVSTDNQSVFDYLVFNRTDLTTDTFYNEIKKLPHGTKFSIDQSGFKIKQWYNLRDRISEGVSSVGEYRELLIDSIRLRMRSDVPIGVCLSGGLDSSSIVSILLNNLGHKGLSTFSAVYNKGEIGDESKFINLYKYSPLCMHKVTPTAQSLFDDTEKFIATIAEPISSTSPYAQYKVMELAKNNVVVTLDGQGADEALAGYHYFYGYLFKEYFTQMKFKSFLSESYQYLSKHHSLLGLQTMFYFFLPPIVQARLRSDISQYINPEFSKAYISTNRVTSTLYNASTLNDSLINHFEYKLEHLLKWEDRNSMNFSLEARVPFLDYRLVEYTLSLKTDSIIKNGYTKHILRQAMKGILPEEIRTRKDKVGFDTPQDEWFRQSIWQERVNEILLQPVLKDYIDLPKARSLYKRHLLRKVNCAKEIWKWVNLYYWVDKFGR